MKLVVRGSAKQIAKLAKIVKSFKGVHVAETITEEGDELPSPPVVETPADDTNTGEGETTETGGEETSTEATETTEGGSTEEVVTAEESTTTETVVSEEPAKTEEVKGKTKPKKNNR